jgi:hypothetical protein
MFINANYSGRQHSNTTMVKEFYFGSVNTLWTTTLYTDTGTGITSAVITPATPSINSLWIPGNLYVDGSIITPSDELLKNGIGEISIEKTQSLMNLHPKQYTLKSDPKNQIHYGFIADEMKEILPEMVTTKPDKNMNDLKGINYLELIPLLVNKIQIMQREIDELNRKVNNL